MYTLDPGHVNLYCYNLREPYIYKPYGFVLFRLLTTFNLCIFCILVSSYFFCREKKKTKKTNGPGGFCNNLSAWAFQLFRQEVRIWRIQHWLYIVKLMANYSDFIRIFREGLSSSFNFRYFLYSFLKSVHWLRMTGAEDSLLLSLYILKVTP